MMAELIERVLGRGDAGDDPGPARVLYDAALEAGDHALAAAALDRLYGLVPDDARVIAARRALLDALSLDEHGLHWRYVPAGSFLMGSTTGDLDEQPVHTVRLGAYWLTDVCITWDDYRRLGGSDAELVGRVQRYYCGTTADPNDPANRFDVKPLVAVRWAGAEQLAAKLGGGARYGLPSEAEWERAARGGLIGKRYSWGDEPPDRTRCDFDHYGEFVLAEPRSLPPNGYGLYGMCGGVWEWTSSGYDALAYHPRRPVDGPKPPLRVLRGGSFTDAAAAVTVSFRATIPGWDMDTGDPYDDADNPNVGFRLARWAK